MLHCLESIREPWQSLPPFWGAGLLHLRDLICNPPPHDDEHIVHPVHGPNSPSTGPAEGSIYSMCPLWCLIEGGLE